jgi:hypothetical protein
MNFDPPAPVVDVSLRNPQDGKIVSGVILLLDTGADITLLPIKAVGQLGVALLPNKEYELVGFDGHASYAHVAELLMIWLGKGFRGRYLVVDKEYGILGRDVLNHLALLLNGPLLQLDEAKIP